MNDRESNYYSTADLPAARRTYVPAPEYRTEVRYDDNGNIDRVVLYDSERPVACLGRWTRDEWRLDLYPSRSIDGDRNLDITRCKKRVEVTER